MGAGEWKSCPGRHKNITGQGFIGCVTEGCFTTTEKKAHMLERESKVAGRFVDVQKHSISNCSNLSHKVECRLKFKTFTQTYQFKLCILLYKDIFRSTKVQGKIAV